MSRQGILRLQKEYKTLLKDFNGQIDSHPEGLITKDNFIAAPDPKNIFVWYFVIFGLDGPFKGGFYMGQLGFPDNFPWSPPYIKMLTPNGKMMPNVKQCLTISDHHPETWDPIWTNRSLVIGVISFLLSKDDWNG